MSFQDNLTTDHYKLIWLVGAAERLATLGLFDSNIPLRLGEEALDTYLEIDEYRNILFENDFEVAQLFKIMAQSESEVEISSSDMSSLVNIILAFKNDRVNLVKYALCQQAV